MKKKTLIIKDGNNKQEKNIYWQKAHDEKFKFQAEIKVCEENKVSMIQTVSWNIIIIISLSEDIL